MTKKRTLDLTKLSNVERRMVEEIIALKKREVKGIIIPKNEVVALSHEQDLDDALQVYARHHYSRYPVYYGNLDRIVGILYIKDIIQFWYDYRKYSVVEFIRFPHFIYEDRPALDVFLELQRMRISLSVTIDEFGGVSGIVTIEDLIEEIVGDIEDEFDKRKKPYVKKVGENEYVVNARMELDDFTEFFSIPISGLDITTVSGLIVQCADRIPKTGESICYRNLIFTILEGTRRKIIKVQVRVIPQDTKH